MLKIYQHDVAPSGEEMDPEPVLSLKIMNIGRTLKDDSLAARCLTLNSYLIDR